jgi:hypothetical protein
MAQLPQDSKGTLQIITAYGKNKKIMFLANKFGKLNYLHNLCIRKQR